MAGLGPRKGLVAACLLAHAGAFNHAHLSQREAARETGTSLDTVATAMRELRADYPTRLYAEDGILGGDRMAVMVGDGTTW